MVRLSGWVESVWLDDSEHRSSSQFVLVAEID